MASILEMSLSRMQDQNILLMGELSNADKAIRSGASDADLVDAGFLSRELENMFDELRKEAKARREFVEMELTKRGATRVVSGEDSDNLVHGTLARAKVDAVMTANIPEKGTPEWGRLMKDLGIPEEPVKNGLVSVSFRGLSSLLTARAEKGLPPPAGISRMYAQPKVVFTRKA